METEDNNDNQNSVLGNGGGNEVAQGVNNNKANDTYDEVDNWIEQRHI